MKIDLRELWNKDIVPPAELSDVMNRLFKGPAKEAAFIRDRQFNVAADYPPLFIYYEQRASQNNFDIQTYYGGGGSKTAILEFSASRSILHLNTNYLQNRERGEILNAFCCLEFVIEVLVCIKFGVFDDKHTYQELKKLYVDDGTNAGSLSSFAKRLKYLYDVAPVLSKKTNHLLLKAKLIRDSLAHQYLPLDSYGVTTKDVARYGHVLKAIDTIFDAAWFYLLTDYNKQQLKVAKWLEQAPRLP